MVEKLSASDFVAEAPLDEMSIVNAIPVYVTAKNTYYRDAIDVLDKTNSISVAIENLTTKNYDIQVEYKGEPAEGYCRAKVALAKSQVTVTAPESVQKSINKASITIDQSNYMEDFSGKYAIRLYRTDGTEIAKNTNIRLNPDRVKATVTIYKLITIPVAAEYKGLPANGYESTDVLVEPDNIGVMGREEDLAGLTGISIPGEAVNITGASTTVVKEINISRYLPENCKVYNADDETIKVTVKIEAQVTKSINVSTSDIKLLNKPSNLGVKFLDEGAVKVEVEGLEEYLNQVDKDSLQATLDLSKAVEGDNSLPLQVSLPHGVTLSKAVKVGVNLYDETEETPTSKEE